MRCEATDPGMKGTGRLPLLLSLEFQRNADPQKHAQRTLLADVRGRLPPTLGGIVTDSTICHCPMETGIGLSSQAQATGQSP